MSLVEGSVAGGGFASLSVRLCGGEISESAETSEIDRANPQVYENENHVRNNELSV